MSQYSHVTDDLLSAYLDDAVTASERTLVEAAVANDPDVAWRLMTLQHTVDLLGKLPDLTLPRSFILSEAMVAEATMEPVGASAASRVAPQPAHDAHTTGFWASWRSFWQGGNLFLRNAAAASLAAFLVLAVGGFAFAPAGAPAPMASSGSVARQSVAPARGADAAFSVQPPGDGRSAEESDAVAMATAPVPDVAAAESAPASQAQPAAARVAPPAAPESAESIPASPSPAEETSAPEAAAASAPAGEAQADAESPALAEVVTAAAVMAEDAAGAEAPATESNAAQSSVVASTRTGTLVATGMVTGLAAAPAAAVGEADKAEESDAPEEGENSETGADGGEEVPAPMAVAIAPAAEDAGDSVTEPAADAPVMEAEASETSAPEVALAKAPQNAPAPVQGNVSPVRSTSSEALGLTSFQYLQLIALALALLFASLWLLSRRNAPPSR